MADTSCTVSVTNSAGTTTQTGLAWRAAMAEVYALTAEACDADGFSSGGRGACFSDLPTPGDPPHAFEITIGEHTLSLALEPAA